MTNPVAPVEGPLYLLFTEYENTTNIRKWSKEPFYGAQEYVPVGELERLRAALNDIFEMWAGSEGFIPHTAPEGYLLMLVKKMADRAALAKMEESKSCKS